MSGPAIDNVQFRRILTRNVALPLGMSLLTAVLFVCVIAYLINVLDWVQRSERVISSANEVSRLSADMETGMRGYLISGDESFLSPYLLAGQRIDAGVRQLSQLVAENQLQSDRVRRIETAQHQWEQFASEMIARRRDDTGDMSRRSNPDAASC